MSGEWSEGGGALRSEAIILRRTNYGEADRIIQLITPDNGKVAAMARGVRREKSRLAGGIELLSVTDVVLQRGKGDLAILTSARLHTFFTHIVQDYERLTFAYEALKKIDTAVEAAPEPEWYWLVKQTLTSLNTPTTDVRLTEAWFRLQYSHLLGQGLNLQTDTSGAALAPEVTYHYSAAEMGFALVARGDITADHIKVLRLLSQGNPEVVSRIAGIETLLPVCLWVVRQHAQV